MLKESVTEKEIREVLTQYVEKQGCWGGRPAHKWPISRIEECNVYIGTLETFIEERDVERLVKSYSGGAVDDRANGHVPGPWEIDMRHEFPLLFTPKKKCLVRKFPLRNQFKLLEIVLVGRRFLPFVQSKQRHQLLCIWRDYRLCSLPRGQGHCLRANS